METLRVAVWGGGGWLKNMGKGKVFGFQFRFNGVNGLISLGLEHGFLRLCGGTSIMGDML